MKSIQSYMTSSGPLSNDVTDALRKAPDRQGLYIPGNGGNAYTLSEPVAMDGVNVDTDLMDTRIEYVGTANPGVPVLDLSDSSGQYGCLWRGGWFVGPGGQSLGEKSAHVDGIRMSVGGTLLRARVNRFDSGVVVHSTSGHVTIEKCSLSGCYFNVYSDINAGGPGIYQCNLAFALMANIGLHPIEGCNKMTVRDTQGGYAPYGIYQLPLDQAGLQAAGRDSTFLDGAVLDGFDFELIGNGPVISDVLGFDGVGNHRGNTAGITLTRCGLTWDTDGRYTLPGRNRDWVIAGDVLRGIYDQTGQLSGPAITVISDAGNSFRPCPQGGKGIFAFNQCPPGIVMYDGKLMDAYSPHGQTMIPGPVSQ